MLLAEPRHDGNSQRRAAAVEAILRIPAGQSRSALGRVDEALERSQSLHAQGHVVTAIVLLKYVDLLRARFNLAVAQNEPHVRRTRRGCSEGEAATMATPDDAVRVTGTGMD